MLDTDKYNTEDQQILQIVLATISTNLWDLRFPQQLCWEFRYSGMWHCVAGLVFPGVLKEQSAFFISYSWGVQGELSSHTWTLGNKRTAVL